jgi:hypothetical protein
MGNNSLVYEQETKIIVMKQLLQSVLEEADETGGTITPETLEKIEIFLEDSLDDFVETLDD